MQIEVKVDATVLAGRIGKILSPQVRKSLSDTVARRIAIRIQDHLDTMSVSRHKTADRLGAKHTKHFEYASGRTAGGPAGKGVFVEDVQADGASIEIRGTPGLRRAFGLVEIKPTGGKKWLTIPISRIAYGKRVKELRDEGHRIFRPGKARILAESGGKSKVENGESKKAKKRLRPLYALVKSAKLPQDKGLLPTNAALQRWAEAGAKDFIDAIGALA